MMAIASMNQLSQTCRTTAGRSLLLKSRTADKRSQFFCLAFGCLVVCSGCQGGYHRKGDLQIAFTGTYGHAVKGETFWADGKGRGDSASASVGLNYFAEDRLALMAELTPMRFFNQSDGDAYSYELSLGARYYFAEFELGTMPVSLYAEILGGMMHGAHSIPEEGSNFNFTQDTGVGMEMKLADNVSWITGYRFQHLSNGDLFNDDNPSQNDNQVYTGIAIELK
ncbi:MAG: acyloxyacyl hydrolase [Phycisphaerales bacterium]|nr:acyloxyacyl hydrolase [Phycisphaerales bacterium]